MESFNCKAASWGSCSKSNVAFDLRVCDANIRNSSGCDGSDKSEWDICHASGDFWKDSKNAVASFFSPCPAVGEYMAVSACVTFSMVEMSMEVPMVIQSA